MLDVPEYLYTVQVLKVLLGFLLLHDETYLSLACGKEFKNAKRSRHVAKVGVYGRAQRTHVADQLNDFLRIEVEIIEGRDVWDRFIDHIVEPREQDAAGWAEERLAREVIGS